LLASIARLRFADKGIIKLWTNESKASTIERQGVGYLVVSPLGSTPVGHETANEIEGRHSTDSLAIGLP